MDSDATFSITLNESVRHVDKGAQRDLVENSESQDDLRCMKTFS